MKKTSIALAACAAIISSVIVYAYTTDQSSPAAPVTSEDRNTATMPNQSGMDVAPNPNSGIDAQAAPKSHEESNSAQTPADTNPFDDNAAPIPGSTAAPNGPPMQPTNPTDTQNSEDNTSDGGIVE